MFKCRSEHRPQTRTSGLQCTFVDGSLQRQGGFRSGDGGNFRGFEPAVFFNLMIGHGFQRWLGAHDNHSLEFAIDLSGFAPDKKLADIKFRHVAAFPWKNIVVFNAIHPQRGCVSLAGQYGSSCVPAAELSRRHDETSIGVKDSPTSNA